MKNLHPYSFWLCLIIVAFGCSQLDGRKDEVPHDFPGITIEDSPILDRWLDFHNLQASDFDTLSMETTSFLTMGEHLFQEVYKQYFIVSPDSSRFIDLDSYSRILEKKNGEVHFLGSEADTEVAIVDFSDSTRTRILFCGPSCIPEEAFWADSNRVYVLGHADETGQQYLPFVYVYDLDKRNVYRFMAKKEGRTPNEYVEEVRMADVAFEF